MMTQHTDTPETLTVFNETAQLRGYSAPSGIASWRFDDGDFRVTVYRYDDNRGHAAKPRFRVAVSLKDPRGVQRLVTGNGATLQIAERDAAAQIQSRGRGSE